PAGHRGAHEDRHSRGLPGHDPQARCVPAPRGGAVAGDLVPGEEPERIELVDRVLVVLGNDDLHGLLDGRPGVPVIPAICREIAGITGIAAPTRYLLHHRKSSGGAPPVLLLLGMSTDLLLASPFPS